MGIMENSGTRGEWALEESSGIGIPYEETGCHGIEFLSAAGESALGRTGYVFGGASPQRSASESTGKISEFGHKRTPQSQEAHGHLSEKPTNSLRVVKFGGTSVGSADSIEKVVEIVRSASREKDVVVVVSAMSGVTNKLVQAVAQAEAGETLRVAAIFLELRKQHEAAVSALVSRETERMRIGASLDRILLEGHDLCKSAIGAREMSLASRDFVTGLGERLCTLIVAAALAERGVCSAAIEATELIVTNERHGAAEPFMELTRERCEQRLRPLLRQGIVPVVTGFIGATPGGAATTLGRGGSDYSATILGAALDAEDVVIWTDVDGVLTADPRLVPGACTLAEISYSEATELAHFGAKVLHPKTLRPLIDSDIPVWIRNTFAPASAGTKITPAGPGSREGVIALTAMSEVSTIIVSGPGMVSVKEVLKRTTMAAGRVQAEILLTAESPSQFSIRLVVPRAFTERTLEALRCEFAQDFATGMVNAITFDEAVAMVTVVGRYSGGASAIAGRTFEALGRDGVNVIAAAVGSSERNISFVVANQDMHAALTSIHREFQLDKVKAETVPAKTA